MSKHDTENLWIIGLVLVTLLIVITALRLLEAIFNTAWNILLSSIAACGGIYLKVIKFRHWNSLLVAYFIAFFPVRLEWDSTEVVTTNWGFTHELVEEKMVRKQILFDACCCPDRVWCFFSEMRM